MKYRRFGKTNLNLSVFSLGTMRCLASEENAIQTVQRALELGINHVETARGYGESERYLGRALAHLSLRPFITTKLVPPTDPVELRRQLEESLNRLGLQSVDALALHGINTPEHLRLALACQETLHQLQQEGLFRHLGFSTHGSLELIQTTLRTGLFEFVNLHYYWSNPRNVVAVQLAADLDIGVFIISPADKGGLLHTPSTKLRDLCQPFSPLALNYRFLLSDSRIHTLSLGAATPQELDTPLAFADQDETLSAEEQVALARLEAALQTLGPERCAQCYACIPCPEEIQIPEVLRLRNLAVALDMEAYGQYRYRMFENAGHWFPGRKGNRCNDCGDCLPRCPQELDIPALLRDAHEQLHQGEGRRLWG
ncbi:aldo/keto reductase [Leptolyngbya sp. FACHB-261]|uniref:aldo/keto reductase n=1 Tax=Leptolyngbya sp. FACHB-261 TaxID=2692806 RepID=UPI0016895CBC|nr:aldo/keto reductase [Leptolyngbya sp. FACHB-261]MBD2100123.1 aldo/keto reductase [Leptolyngbya sp. FACHB-261]